MSDLMIAVLEEVAAQDAAEQSQHSLGSLGEEEQQEHCHQHARRTVHPEFSGVPLQSLLPLVHLGRETNITEG